MHNTLQTHSNYWQCSLANAAELNVQIANAYKREKSEATTRQTHYFAGRFENIYIDIARLPELSALLQQVREVAGNILHLSPQKLRIGFWFNEMAPGQITLKHSHDDDDELLSAVYYVSVPEKSGDLVLSDAQGKVCIQPCEGNLILFKPDLPHEVEENKSDQTRLSIGINIGET